MGWLKCFGYCLIVGFFSLMFLIFGSIAIETIFIFNSSALAGFILLILYFNTLFLYGFVIVGNMVSAVESALEVR